jgi:hypothetical protein
MPHLKRSTPSATGLRVVNAGGSVSMYQLTNRGRNLHFGWRQDGLFNVAGGTVTRLQGTACNIKIVRVTAGDRV